MDQVAVPVAILPSLRTSIGEIFCEPSRYIVRDHVEQEEFRKLLAMMVPVADLKTLRSQAFVVLAFRGGPEVLEAVFESLIAGGCDLIGVMDHGAGECSAVARRTRLRCVLKKPAAPLDFAFDKIFVLRTQGKKSSDSDVDMFKVLESWLLTGLHAKTNFRLAGIDDKEWCMADLIAAWSGVSLDEMHLDILASEERFAMKRGYTPRQHYVAKMGRKVMTYMKELRVGTSTCLELADSVDAIPFHVFDNLLEVRCKTFDVISGELLDYGVLDWLRAGHWRTHTLVLHGDAGVGKTPLAMSLMCEIAATLQRECSWKPYYLKVGTVEGLRGATSAGLMKALIPVLFDDITPDKACGTRSGMPLEDVKLLCEVVQSSNVHARNKDLAFSTDQPRIFTSNAMVPNEWHHGLPIGVFEATALHRCSYSPNVKAAFKRISFAFVPRSLVNAEIRSRHVSARRSSHHAV